MTGGGGEANEGNNNMHVRTTPWVLDRTVNLPFLITVILAIMGASAAYGEMNNRVSNVEVATRDIPEMSRRLERMDERGEGLRRDVDKVIREIEETRK